MTVLVSHYDGAELNSPNDIVVKRDGSVYFTDPPFGREPKVGIPRRTQLDFNGVYRWDPAEDSLRLLTKALNRPNGLCFSADESLLYINDSPEYKIYVFDVAADSGISNRRLFAETKRRRARRARWHEDRQRRQSLLLRPRRFAHLSR